MLLYYCRLPFDVIALPQLLTAVYVYPRRLRSSCLYLVIQPYSDDPLRRSPIPYLTASNSALNLVLAIGVY